MSLYALKPRFQDFLRPAMRLMHRCAITANQVTVATVGISLVLGAWIASHADQVVVFLVLPLWLFLRMALNAIDGMLAREHGQATPIGAWLNEIGDIASDVALYLPFAWVTGASTAPVVAVVILAVLAEATGPLALIRGTARRYDGPMGKADRAFVFGAIALALGAGVPAGVWVDVTMALTAVALIVTIARRLARGTGPSLS